MSSSLAGLLLLGQQQDPGLRLNSSLGTSFNWFPVVWTISMGILVGLAVVAAIYAVAATAWFTVAQRVWSVRQQLRERT